MINDLEDISINNSEVKNFLIESMGEDVQFCPSTRSNESLFVISSEISLQDVVKILRSLDATKLVAKKIRKCLLAIDFGLNDKFCGMKKTTSRTKRTSRINMVNNKSYIIYHHKQCPCLYIIRPTLKLHAFFYKHHLYKHHRLRFGSLLRAVF